MTALIVLGELRLLTEDSMPKDKCTTARRTTLAPTPLPAWSRLAYALHATAVFWLLNALLGPTTGLSILLRKAKSSSRSLTISPEIASLYMQNPFRVLGLAPNGAKARQIVRRRDELIAVMAARVPLTTAVDGYISVRWPNAPEVNEGDVRRAVALSSKSPIDAASPCSGFRPDESTP